MNRLSDPSKRMTHLNDGHMTNPISPSLTSITRAELEGMLSSITDTHIEQKQADAKRIASLQSAIAALVQQIERQTTHIETLTAADALARTQMTNLKGDLLEKSALTPLPSSPKSPSSPKLKEHEAKISAMTELVSYKEEQVAVLMITNKDLSLKQAELAGELEAEKERTAALTKEEEENSNQIAVLTLANEEKVVRIAELELTAELGESQLIEHPTMSLPDPFHGSPSANKPRGCFSLLSF